MLEVFDVVFSESILLFVVFEILPDFTAESLIIGFVAELICIEDAVFLRGCSKILIPDSAVFACAPLGL